MTKKCHMSTDPFQGIDSNDDPFKDDDPSTIVTSEPALDIHIRIQQRNSRKCITIVQGLPKKLNMKKVLQYFKRNFCCNGSIVEDETAGKVLQLQGDQRKVIHDFLIEQKICTKDQVKIHGVL